METNIKNNLIADSENFINSINHDVLKDFAKNSLENFKSTNAPTRKNEAWKYSKYYQDITPGYSSTSLDVSEDNSLPVNTINISDNVVRFHLKESKVTLFSELSTSEQSSYINSLNTDKEAYTNDNIINLQYSLLGDILILKTNNDTSSVIELNIKTKLKTPLHFITDVSKNSKLELMETYTNDSSQLISHYNLIHNNASFEHIIVQNSNIEYDFMCTNISRVYEGASYRNFYINIGGNNSRYNINTQMLAKNCHTDAHGLYMLSGSQQCDINSFINHQVGENTSGQLYKGIIDDSAHGVFKGLIKINKQAQLVNSNQLNKNLLKTKKAKINSLPQLEIFADDVKCSHGSTTGQISQDELFYLMARGIKREQAIKLLTHAYAYDVLIKINNTNFRDSIEELIFK